MNEEIVFKKGFISGHATRKGEFRFAKLINFSGYTLRYPLHYRGSLTLRLTDKSIYLTCMSFPVWQSTLLEITSVKIKPLFAYGAAHIESQNNDTGFFFVTGKLDQLLDAFKKLNIKVEYDQKSLEDYRNRAKILSNPIIVVVGIVLGAAFILFLFYFSWHNTKV